MKNNVLFSILVLTAALFTACKEDDPEPLQAEVKGVLLAGEKGGSKTWKLTGGTAQLNSGSPQTLALDPCQLDDTFKFSNNDAQAYEMRGGTSKCDAADPDLLESGTWAFTIDGKVVLVLSNRFSPSGLFGSIAVPAEVIDLTDSAMKLKMTLIDGSDALTYTLDFIKS